jgi:cellulose synthase operon protein B
MKTILQIGIVVLLLATFSILVPQTIFAQGPQPTPVASAANANDLVLFSQLIGSEKTLRGPFDATGIALNLPLDWRVANNARLELTLNVVFGGSGNVLRSGTGTSSITKGTGPVGGSIQVTFNSTVIANVLLNKEGEQTITIPINADLFADPKRVGRHRVGIALNSAVDCDFDWHTTVVVRNSSRFVLPHDQVSPVTDLRLLPRPLYQGTFTPESVVIVVSDQPTVGELQGALSIAAGLGRMTLGRLALSITPITQLTPEMQKSSNFIFVGNANDFAMLNGVTLPAPISPQGFSAKDAKPDDGIVQMAVSPWNRLRVALIAGGNSDAAVIKAAQALSTGVVKVGAQANLALVSDVRADLNPDVFAVDRTLAAMGYPNITVQDFGINTTEFRFFVPAGQTLTGEAYLDLIFNHSALLDFDKSGIEVSLNDEPIGSARFTDETVKQGTARISIPRTSVRPGVNRLTIETDLFPRFVCVDPSTASLWVTLRMESLLHLPLGASADGALRLADLSGYPGLFSQHPTLSTTGFVLPTNDPSAWNVAAQIASDLGNNSTAAMADLTVSFADAVPENIRKTRDLILIGRPSAMPILNELRDALPASFEPGSDLAVERNVRVVYRIPQGTSVGYLELLNAPWSSNRMILGVLGTDEPGLRAASDAAIQPRLRNQLGGNYAFVNGEQIVIGDTRNGPMVAGVLPTAVPGGTLSIIPPSGSPLTAFTPEKPAWILPTIAASIGLMFLVMLIAGVSHWLQHPRTN